MYPSPGYPAVGNPDTNAWGNTGLKLFGYPVYESASIPSTQTAALTVGAFCDPKTFYIVDRVGMDVEFIPVIFGSNQGNMATGQRALYAYWRNACAPVTVLGGLLIAMAT
jgi:HK97 family phage major capsid protein